MKFETLIQIQTIENQDLWQSLLPDNLLWHWTAFAILAMLLEIITQLYTFGVGKMWNHKYVWESVNFENIFHRNLKNAWILPDECVKGLRGRTCRCRAERQILWFLIFLYSIDDGGFSINWLIDNVWYSLNQWWWLIDIQSLNQWWWLKILLTYLDLESVVVGRALTGA